jgi:hypothetical protein
MLFPSAENESNRFFKNVGSNIPEYMASYSEDSSRNILHKVTTFSLCTFPIFYSLGTSIFVAIQTWSEALSTPLNIPKFKKAEKNCT